MSERTPHGSAEIPGLRVDVYVEDSTDPNVPEQTMRRIIEFVDSYQFDEAQNLITESGIKYSEALKHFPETE